MNMDAGQDMVDEGRRPRRTLDRLTPAGKPAQAEERPAPSSSQEPVDASRRVERNVSRGSEEKVKEAMRGMPPLPAWLGRLGYYGLALLLVAVATVVRWALPEVLSPTPFLVFYLAWVGAAAFGGFGPGLLATVASWLCVDFLFDPTPGQVGFSDPTSVGRLLVLLAGGLGVSLVAERMRRGRIRERKQARELAELVQLTDLGPFLIRDEQDRIVRWSDGCTRFYGFTAEQAIGRLSHELLRTTFPQPLETIRAALHKMGRWEGELTHRCADGTVVHVASLWVLHDGASNPAVLEVSNDITERRQAEALVKEAKKSLERERKILQSIMDGAKNSHLVYLDRDFHFVRVNETYARTCGYTPEEMVGKNHFALYPHAENEAIFRRVRDTGLPREVHDKPFVFPDQPERGTTYWDWTLTPVKDDSGRVEGLAFSLFETTQRKRAEESLRELTRTLESKVAQRTAELEHRARQLQKLTLELSEAEDRERKRLAGILHDDLQQLLAAAKFHVGILNGRLKDDAKSHESATQINDLLNEAIDQSRSLSHELSSPALSHSDLCQVFAWLARQMQTKHGLTVHLDVCDRIELASEPLRVLLYKTVQELLFNVIKHAGVREATLRLRRRRDRICLSVSDKGQGFDAADSGHALGFGLLSVRERIEFLGGRMKIRSAKGKGSTFLIAVPESHPG
ncbi:MAG: hypothetical protein A2Y76_09745 [Planctomycetes bacterium RBG_13_60_9]|nr:MAG: hypothetical protein A2Y76_09745 [Planctomycetes bacterium RBG_13_60_9]